MITINSFLTVAGTLWVTIGLLHVSGLRERHFEPTKERCTFLLARHQRETLFVVVCINWATNRNWQTKLLDTRVCLLVGCLTSQQQTSVSQGRICSDNLTCCHTEIEVADPTFYLTQSQYTDTRPTSPSADPITPGAWQGSHWSANF